MALFCFQRQQPHAHTHAPAQHDGAIPFYHRVAFYLPTSPLVSPLTHGCPHPPRPSSSLYTMGFAAAAAATLLAATAVAAGSAAVPAAAEALSLGNASRAHAVDVSAGRAARRARLVGGRVVSDADAKTGAVFFTKFFTPDGNGYYCGGSLVGPGHVLTRAGCGVEVGDLVRVGGADLFSGVEVRVAAVTTHPHYAALGHLYDVAVVTIAEPPSEQTYLAAGVVPVRLNGWRWTEEADSPRPRDFLVAGFGAVSADAAAAGSVSLKVGTQPLTPWATCTAYTERVPIPVAPAAQVCTNVGAAASVTLCERDMGGPLFKVYEYGGTNVYQLFGVASYWLQEVGGLACVKGLPNVYTRVEAVREWVWSVMYGWNGY